MQLPTLLQIATILWLAIHGMNVNIILLVPGLGFQAEVGGSLGFLPSSTFVLWQYVLGLQILII